MGPQDLSTRFPYRSMAAIVLRENALHQCEDE